MSLVEDLGTVFQVCLGVAGVAEGRGSIWDRRGRFATAYVSQE